MTVAQLVAALQGMPQDAEVFIQQDETAERYTDERAAWLVELLGDGVVIR